jgi:hypothetical protein
MTMPTYISQKSKGLRMKEFLDSLNKTKMPSSSNRRSNIRSYFGEELSTYRSLAQKRYNEIILGHEDADAVSTTQF